MAYSLVMNADIDCASPMTASTNFTAIRAINIDMADSYNTVTVVHCSTLKCDKNSCTSC